MMDMLAQAALSLGAFPFSLLAKATVIMAVALIAVRCAHRAPASMRHIVLASAFAVVLALPLAEFAAPSITLPIDRRVASMAPALPITSVVAAPSTPAAAADTSAPKRAGSTDAVTGPRAGLLFAVWTAGALLCLIPVLLTPWRMRQLRRAARQWPDRDALVRTLGSEAGIQAVAVLVHDEVSAPLTCGVIHPAIVLPADALRWTDEELRRALVHELEHIRRADWPVHVWARIVCALYWFHPLVWAAWRRLRLEAERSCDDSVLQFAEQTAYADQLVMLARRARTSTAPLLSMADRSDLSARIAAVLDETQARGRLGVSRAAAVIVTAVLLLTAVAPLRPAAQGIAQPAAKPAADVPAFDVVSIKENKSGDMVQGSRRQPGRIVITNVPLRLSIVNFFGLQPQQLTGGPDWINSARYDITAQFSGEMPLTEPGTVGPLQLMMQRLFAERFKLAVHTETREIPIYVLTLARSDRTLGPKMRPAATDCDAVMNAMLKSMREGGGPPPAPPQLPDGRPACGMRFGPGNRLTAGGTSMAALARSMSNQAGRIIVDKTGLTGGFDIDLEFTPNPAAAGGQPPAAGGDANAPSLFTALEEQLGLKLVPQRGPVEMLVIDRVERPTEN